MRYILAIILFALPTCLPLVADESARAPRFESDIVPILKAYCWKCHGGEAFQAKLYLRTLPLVLRGGEHGPAIQRGSSDKSLLVQKLAERKMPPAGSLQPSDEHIALIKQWVDSGGQADFDGPITVSTPSVDESARAFWSFQPVIRPQLSVRLTHPPQQTASMYFCSTNSFR